MGLRILLAVALVGALSACSEEVDLTGLDFACDSHSECGAGKVCSGGVCVPEALALQDTQDGDQSAADVQQDAGAEVDVQQDAGPEVDAQQDAGAEVDAQDGDGTAADAQDGDGMAADAQDGDGTAADAQDGDGDGPEPTLCQQYCELMETHCADSISIWFADEQDCQTTCEAWVPGTEGDKTGDTVWCRLFHATVAGMEDPEVHCPHASPDGGGVCADACIPTCADGQECGDDGCGGGCGTCAASETCGVDFQCVSNCVPDCTDASCGDLDGCGNYCWGVELDATCVSPDLPANPCMPVSCNAGACIPETIQAGAACSQDPDGPDYDPCLAESGACDADGFCVLLAAGDGTPCGDGCDVGTCIDGTCSIESTAVCEPGWSCPAGKGLLDGSPCWPTGAPAITQLTAGAHHTCARVTKIVDSGGEPTIDNDGICWGVPTLGRLGQGSEHAPDGRPVRANIWWEDGDGKLSAGGAHTCLEDGNTVNCWGMIAIGQDGPPLYLQTEVEPGSIDPTVDLASGSGFSCRLRPINPAKQQYGQIKCWGENEKGQCGNDTTVSPQLEPTWVTDANKEGPAEDAAFLSGLAIDAWGEGACVMALGGKVACWGAGAAAWALDAAQPVLRATELQGVSNAVAIAVGGSHVCAIRVFNPGATGTVWCWGDNGLGQLGTTLETESSTSPISVGGGIDAVQVDAGESHTCVVRVSGEVMCWGDNTHGQVTGTATPEPVVYGFPIEGYDAVEVATGASHSCVRYEDGTVQCWGAIGSLGPGISQEMLLGNPSAAGNTTGPLDLGLCESDGACDVDEICVNDASCDVGTSACIVGSVGTIACDDGDPCTQASGPCFSVDCDVCDNTLVCTSGPLCSDGALCVPGGDGAACWAATIQGIQDGDVFAYGSDTCDDGGDGGDCEIFALTADLAETTGGLADGTSLELEVGCTSTWGEGSADTAYTNFVLDGLVTWYGVTLPNEMTCSLVVTAPGAGGAAISAPISVAVSRTNPTIVFDSPTDGSVLQIAQDQDGDMTNGMQPLLLISVTDDEPIEGLLATLTGSGIDTPLELPLFDFEGAWGLGTGILLDTVTVPHGPATLTLTFTDPSGNIAIETIVFGVAACPPCPVGCLDLDNQPCPQIGGVDGTCHCYRAYYYQKDGGSPVGYMCYEAPCPDGMSSCSTSDATNSSTYAAVLTTQAERDFVQQHFLNDDRMWWTTSYGDEGQWMYLGPWIGLVQDAEQAGTDPAAGWKWITGEPFDEDDALWAIGQPNDSVVNGGIEAGVQQYAHYARMDAPSYPQRYNDMRNDALVHACLLELVPDGL